MHCHYTVFLLLLFFSFFFHRRFFFALHWRHRSPNESCTFVGLATRLKETVESDANCNCNQTKQNNISSYFLWQKSIRLTTLISQYFDHFASCLLFLPLRFFLSISICFSFMQADTQSLGLTWKWSHLLFVAAAAAAADADECSPQSDWKPVIYRTVMSNVPKAKFEYVVAKSLNMKEYRSAVLIDIVIPMCTRTIFTDTQTHEEIALSVLPMVYIVISALVAFISGSFFCLHHFHWIKLL